MLTVTVRVWASEEDSEEREVRVNRMDLVSQVALEGFRFRRGADPVALEILGVD